MGKGTPCLTELNHNFMLFVLDSCVGQGIGKILSIRSIRSAPWDLGDMLCTHLVGFHLYPYMFTEANKV